MAEVCRGSHKAAGCMLAASRALPARRRPSRRCHSARRVAMCESSSARSRHARGRKRSTAHMPHAVTAASHALYNLGARQIACSLHGSRAVQATPQRVGCWCAAMCHHRRALGTRTPQVLTRHHMPHAWDRWVASHALCNRGAWRIVCSLHGGRAARHVRARGCAAIMASVAVRAGMWSW